MVAKANIKGCCIGALYYDLGSVHGHATAKSFEDFAEKIYDKGYSSLNIAITNQYQPKEKEWLVRLGFSDPSPISGLRVHVVDGMTLQKNLAFVQDFKRKRLEEKRKREAERRQKQATKNPKGFKRLTVTEIRANVPGAGRYGYDDYIYGIQMQERIRNYIIHNYGYYVPSSFTTLKSLVDNVNRKRGL